MQIYGRSAKILDLTQEKRYSLLAARYINDTMFTIQKMARADTGADSVHQPTL